MTRVFLADATFDIRLALRLLLADMQMLVVGEAVDWPSTMSLVPPTNPDMLVLDWELPAGAHPGAAIAELRLTFPNLHVAVLSGQLEARQAALHAGADTFIAIGDAPDRVAERLRRAAAQIA